uniref:CSD domain-containing protein n=1 Tax=viral metagenome TaxID=1070528 RepID=A0A6C0KP20_9ZZZZ
MSNSADVSSSTVVSNERFIGRVKWFNNKSGYGFISVTEGPKAGCDVFVHHSAVKVVSEQYKYLVQGEYVEFTLVETKTENHDFQVGEVSGIKGGKLMCETRRDLRDSRSTYTSNQNQSGNIEMPRESRSSRPVRPRVQRPRDNSDWNLVKKNTN